MRSGQKTPEYPIGALVPILQHSCKGGKLGRYGKVVTLGLNMQPVTAACVDCLKSVSVDIATMRAENDTSHT